MGKSNVYDEIEIVIENKTIKTENMEIKEIATYISA